MKSPNKYHYVIITMSAINNIMTIQELLVSFANRKRNKEKLIDRPPITKALEGRGGRGSRRELYPCGPRLVEESYVQ